MDDTDPATATCPRSALWAIRWQKHLNGARTKAYKHGLPLEQDVRDHQHFTLGYGYYRKMIYMSKFRGAGQEYLWWEHMLSPSGSPRLPCGCAARDFCPGRKERFPLQDGASLTELGSLHDISASIIDTYDHEFTRYAAFQSAQECSYSERQTNANCGLAGSDRTVTVDDVKVPKLTYIAERMQISDELLGRLTSDTGKVAKFCDSTNSPVQIGTAVDATVGSGGFSGMQRFCPDWKSKAACDQFEREFCNYYTEAASFDVKRNEYIPPEGISTSDENPHGGHATLGPKEARGVYGNARKNRTNSVVRNDYESADEMCPAGSPLHAYMTRLVADYNFATGSSMFGLRSTGTSASTSKISEFADRVRAQREQAQTHEGNFVTCTESGLCGDGRGGCGNAGGNAPGINDKKFYSCYDQSHTASDTDTRNTFPFGLFGEVASEDSSARPQQCALLLNTYYDGESSESTTIRLEYACTESSQVLATVAKHWQARGLYTRSPLLDDLSRELHQLGLRSNHGNPAMRSRYEGLARAVCAGPPVLSLLYCAVYSDALSSGEMADISEIYRVYTAGGAGKRCAVLYPNLMESGGLAFYRPVTGVGETAMFFKPDKGFIVEPPVAGSYPRFPNEFDLTMSRKDGVASSHEVHLNVRGLVDNHRASTVLQRGNTLVQNLCARFYQTLRGTAHWHLGTASADASTASATRTVSPGGSGRYTQNFGLAGQTAVSTVLRTAEGVVDFTDREAHPQAFTDGEGMACMAYVPSSKHNDTLQCVHVFDDTECARFAVGQRAVDSAGVFDVTDVQCLKTEAERGYGGRGPTIFPADYDPTIGCPSQHWSTVFARDHTGEEVPQCCDDCDMSSLVLRDVTSCFSNMDKCEAKMEGLLDSVMCEGFGPMINAIMKTVQEFSTLFTALRAGGTYTDPKQSDPRTIKTGGGSASVYDRHVPQDATGQFSFTQQEMDWILNQSPCVTSDFTKSMEMMQHYNYFNGDNIFADAGNAYFRFGAKIDTEIGSFADAASSVANLQETFDCLLRTTGMSSRMFGTFELAAIHQTEQYGPNSDYKFINWCNFCCDQVHSYCMKQNKPGGKCEGCNAQGFGTCGLDPNQDETVRQLFGYCQYQEPAVEGNECVSHQFGDMSTQPASDIEALLTSKAVVARGKIRETDR